MKPALGGVSGGSMPAADETTNVDGVKLMTRRVAGLDKAALRGISDSLRDRLGSGVVVLAADSDGKVSLVVSVTKDLTGRVQAGSSSRSSRPSSAAGAAAVPISPKPEAKIRRRSTSSWPGRPTSSAPCWLASRKLGRDRAARLRQGHGGQPSRAFMSEGWG